MQTNPVKELTRLKEKTESNEKAHRAYVVSAMCEAYAQVVDMRTSKRVRRTFFKMAKVPKEHRQRASLTIEALCYVFGSRNKAAQKIASKRARCLEYLEMQKAPVSPDEIKRRGGPTKIYNEAKAQDPKRPAKNGIIPTTPEPAVSNAHKKNEPKASDQSLQCPWQPLQVEIRSPQLDELRKLKVGVKATVEVKRTEGKFLIRVQKLK